MVDDVAIDAVGRGEVEVELAGVTRRFEGAGRGASTAGATAHGAAGGEPARAAALEGVSLSVSRGEIVVLVGPSGCGKSTTLRLIAGLDDPDEGEVRIGGRSMRGVAPQARDVAMVFQGYALYPHMTAREIIEFPLRMRKAGQAERARAVDEAAAMLGIGPLLDRRPDQLSGGERQRVAMGRAIVRRPRVFLFDEPLSNLDAQLRGELRLELGALIRRLGATALYVTHDHVEAMTLADRIAVLRAGRVLQIGSPRELYERPSCSFVGAFLGSPRMNLAPATLRDGQLTAGPLRWPAPRGLEAASVEVGVRPEHVVVRGVASSEGGAVASGAGCAEATVVVAEPLGAESHVLLDVGGVRLMARVEGFSALRPGDRAVVTVDAARLHPFDARTGDRLEAASTVAVGRGP